MAKTITWSIPDTPSITATPQAGGSLVEGTTYYYKILAGHTQWYYLDFNGMSVLSNEVSFTPDATNKSVKLDWSACSGASYYNVYRTTVSGEYTTSNCVKFYCESGSTGVGTDRYPTTDQLTFTDDGTKSTGTTYKYFPMGLNTDKYPYNFEPFTYGIAGLKLEGGTSADPITFQDIYDQAVIDGFTDYCYWDGINFGLMASLDLATSTETHFKQTNGSFTSISSIDFYSSHADSKIQFGDISNGNTKQGVSIQRMGRGYVYVRNGAYFYNCNIQDIKDEDRWSNNSIDITYGGFTHWQYSSGNFVGCTANRTFNYYDYIQEDMHVEDRVEIYRSPRLQYNASGDYLRNYGGYPSDMELFRFDTFTAYNPDYQVYHRSNYVRTPTTGHNTKVIDFTAVNTTRADKLPTVYFYGTEEKMLYSYVRVYYSLMLKVTDQNENPISDAIVSIKKPNGETAEDYDTTLSMTTNSEGYASIENITATGVTSDTITDSSKSWETDEWKGRNIFVYNGDGKGAKYKIKSNTATTLTLTKDFSITPAIGDKVGIIPEILTADLTYKPNSGYGYGDDHTDITKYGPFTITASKAGYETYSIERDITAKVDETIALKTSTNIMIDDRGEVFKRVKPTDIGDNRKLLIKLK